MLKKFSYIRATSIGDATRKLSSPEAVVHAGGTDLLGCLRDDVFEARTVVSISGIDELKGVSASGGGLTIGALTTLSEVAADEAIAASYPVLAQAAGEVGSPQLRNQGTIGGNLCQRPRCWYFRGDFHCTKKGGAMCYAYSGENQYHCIFGGGPCYIVYPSDVAPALAVLGARVQIAGPGGKRTVAIEQFYQLPRQSVARENVLAPNEIVTEIQLPPVNGAMKSSFRKVRARQAFDFALASSAIALQFNGGAVEQARIVLGGVAPIPWRARRAEQVLEGKKLDAGVAARAAEAAVEGAEPLELNGYKVELVKGMLQEELQALA